MSAILYIIATPIGNLEDITYRAVRILSEVDLIAAEDTRHTLKLLSHFGISKPMTSYFDYNQKLKGERILSELRNGRSVALVSDAGTPCISDPGYNLVRDAIAKGIQVVPVPGVSAAITALSASGLPTDIFSFAGFPPSRQGKRRSFLAAQQYLPGTLILYEAPHRLVDTLRDLQFVMGCRVVVVARELTKIYEEFVSGSFEDVIAHFSKGCVRGEVVILVSPGVPLATIEISLEDELERLFSEGLSVKDATRQLAEITGKPRSEIYSLAIGVRKSH